MDLYIKALAGRDLPAKDLNGKSDPYIIFKLDGVEQKTQIQKKTLNPVWNEEFIFPDAKPTSTLKIRVYDYDRIGKDDKISKFNIAIGSLPPGRVIDRWFKFANNGSTNNGQVHMIVHYCIKGYPPFELIPIEDIPAEYRRIPPPAPPVEPPQRDFPPIQEKPYGYHGSKDIYGYIQLGQLDCIQYWFEKECNMDRSQLEIKLDEYDNTPLCLAAVFCQLDIIIYLLKVGSPIIDNNCGYTPLHYVAQKSLECTKAIYALTNGADIETIDNWLETPLIKACGHNQTDIITFLLSQGANPNQIPGNGNTGLLLAVARTNFNVAQALLESGATETINWLNVDKETPLTWAVKKNDQKLVELLLQHGADVNLQFTKKRVKNPLHYAAEIGNMQIVQMLVEAGGNPQLPDHKGRTAIDLAKKKWNRKVAKYLKSVQQ